MACILQHECNFLHGFFRCCLPVEMVDVKVRIMSTQGTHMFQRDRMCQIIKCNPYSTRLYPHPTLVKKVRTYLELEGKLGPRYQPQPNQSRLTQPNTNPLMRKEPKTTDKRRKLIPTKRYKVRVVAKPKATPKTSNTTTQPPSALMNTDKENPPQEGTSESNPTQLECIPTMQAPNGLKQGKCQEMCLN